MPSTIAPGEVLGIYGQQLASDIARFFRRFAPVGLPDISRNPPMVLPFAAADEIQQGEMIQFRDEFLTVFGERTTDEEIDYFKNHAVQKAGKPDVDNDLQHLRRRTWGVSISYVPRPEDDKYQTGIAIVRGPACVEAALGDATASAVGNFIVPFTDKVRAGKVEVRPYGIARCIEQEPELEGWRWVMLGDCKWDFIGKTTTTHNKDSTHTVNVHFGTAKGGETPTGLTQSCYNRFADLDSGLWVIGTFEYLGCELTVAECV